jgi:hypothetical protein
MHPRANDRWDLDTNFSDHSHGFFCDDLGQYQVTSITVIRLALLKVQGFQILNTQCGVDQGEGKVLLSTFQVECAKLLHSERTQGQCH